MCRYSTQPSPISCSPFPPAPRWCGASGPVQGLAGRDRSPWDGARGRIVEQIQLPRLLVERDEPYRATIIARSWEAPHVPPARRDARGHRACVRGLRASHRPAHPHATSITTGRDSTHDAGHARRRADVVGPLERVENRQRGNDGQAPDDPRLFHPAGLRAGARPAARWRDGRARAHPSWRGTRRVPDECAVVRFHRSRFCAPMSRCSSEVAVCSKQNRGRLCKGVRHRTRGHRWATRTLP